MSRRLMMALPAVAFAFFSLPGNRPDFASRKNATIELDDEKKTTENETIASTDTSDFANSRHAAMFPAPPAPYSAADGSGSPDDLPRRPMPERFRLEDPSTVLDLQRNQPPPVGHATLRSGLGVELTSW